MGRTVSEKFGCESVDEVTNGVEVEGNVKPCNEITLVQSAVTPNLFRSVLSPLCV